MVRRAALLGIALLGGCTTSQGKLGLVAHDPDLLGTKVLRPGATGRSCATFVLGMSLGSPPSLAAAVEQLLALDREANVVLDAEVSRFDVVTFLLNRRCIEVHGDLARGVPTVTIPVPGHQHGKH